MKQVYQVNEKAEASRVGGVKSVGRVNGRRREKEADLESDFIHSGARVQPSPVRKKIRTGQSRDRGVWAELEGPGSANGPGFHASTWGYWRS